jgi:hypothetical protein
VSFAIAVSSSEPINTGMTMKLTLARSNTPNNATAP